MFFYGFKMYVFKDSWFELVFMIIKFEFGYDMFIDFIGKGGVILICFEFNYEMDCDFVKKLIIVVFMVDYLGIVNFKKFDIIWDNNVCGMFIFFEKSEYIGLIELIWKIIGKFINV